MEDFSSQSSLLNKDIPKNRKTLGSNKIKYFVPIGILILVASLAIYFLIFKQNNTTKNSGEQNPKSATNSASTKTSSNLCPEKQEFTSEKQGYTACFPKGWISKELTESNIKVGFDQATIDETFPGTIYVTLTDKSENVRITEVSENSSKYEFGKITLDGVRGSQITFTRGRDDPLVAYPFGIETIVVNHNRTYLITLVSKQEISETNQTIYQQFLDDFTFATTLGEPPWSDSGNILVYSPWPNETIKNPVSLAGEAIAFEGIVSVRIKDSDGHTLTETTLKTASNVERSKFSGNISYSKPSVKTGIIEIFTRSDGEDQEQDKVSIPISF